MRGDGLIIIHEICVLPVQKKMMYILFLCMCIFMLVRYKQQQHLTNKTILPSAEAVNLTSSFFINVLVVASTTPLLPFVELLVSVSGAFCTCTVFGELLSDVVPANTAGLLLLELEHAPILSLGLQLTLQRTDPIYYSACTRR